MAVTPEPTLDRVVRFRRVFNVRDLGGLPTSDGRSVRRGLVYRADGVHRLADEDLADARALGLRTVIDLRTEEELARGRFPVEHHPVDWHHLPVLRRTWHAEDLRPDTSAAEFLRDRYLDMLVEGGGSLARAIELIADGTPALFHCAAGKDRTGVLATMVLGLLDVSTDEIAGDYHASAAAMVDFADWIRTEFPEAATAMEDQPRQFLEAPREAMHGFLDTVEARYGSVEGLALELGVTHPTITALRAHLLT